MMYFSVPSSRDSRLPWLLSRSYITKYLELANFHGHAFHSFDIDIAGIGNDGSIANIGSIIVWYPFCRGFQSLEGCKSGIHRGQWHRWIWQTPIRSSDVCSHRWTYNPNITLEQWRRLISDSKSKMRCGIHTTFRMSFQLGTSRKIKARRPPGITRKEYPFAGCWYRITGSRQNFCRTTWFSSFQFICGHFRGHWCIQVDGIKFWRNRKYVENTKKKRRPWTERSQLRYWK